MKKSTFFKTLLLAAGLLGGSSAWADETTALNPTGTAQLNLETNSTEATSWEASVSSVRAAGTFTTNTVVITKFDASTTLDGKSLVKAELKFHSVCTTSEKNSQLKAAVLNNVSWAVTDVSNGNLNVSGFADNSKTADIAYVGSSGADVTLDVTSWLSADDDKIIGFGIYTGTAREQQITNLTLEVTYSNDVLYTASFNEENGLTPTVTIYSNEERTSSVTNGTLIDGTTYYYRAVSEGYTDYDGSFTVASANPAVNFTMTAKARYTFTVNAVNSVGGTVIQTLYTDEDSYDGKTQYVSCPAYFTGDGNAVTYSKDNTTYYESFISASAGATQTVSYTAYVGEALFFEGEGVEGATVYTTSTFRGRTSSGATGVLSEKTVTNLAVGVYRITVRSIGKAGNTHSLYKTSKSDENKIMDITTSTTGTIRSSIITFDAATNIVADGGYYTTSDNGHGFDYILIEKITSVSATIGATGWTTFASSYALDLSGMTASSGDVIAYYASSVDASSVTMTSTDATVAAGTGLMLKGTAGATVTIPVAASGDALSGKKNFLHLQQIFVHKNVKC